MNKLMINTCTPASTLGSLDRMMDAVFGDLSVRSLGRSLSRVPSVDVVEEDSRYVLVADIPGFDEKDVEIKVDGQLLTISAKLEGKEDAKEQEWLLRERSSSSFARSFTLPRDIDLDGIKATSSKGVLTIELPKHPKAQPRTINVVSA